MAGGVPNNLRGLPPFAGRNMKGGTRSRTASSVFSAAGVQRDGHLPLVQTHQPETVPGAGVRLWGERHRPTCAGRLPVNERKTHNARSDTALCTSRAMVRLAA